MMVSNNRLFVTMSQPSLLLLLWLLLVSPSTSLVSPSSTTTRRSVSSCGFSPQSRSIQSISLLKVQSHLANPSADEDHFHNDNNNNNDNNNKLGRNKHFLTSTILATSIALAGITTTTATSLLPAAYAYVPPDVATQTLERTIQKLKDASGNVDETFKAYEVVAGIITEGEGVGGMVNYKGIQLERGYIADEDTSVYNPGLTLLTESEKQRLVDAVIDARKVGLSTGQWSENNEFAFEFLRGNLDPLHMTELKGYLGIVPYYAAILYIAVLAVQQFAKGIFPVAYLVGVAAFVLPIIALIVAGP